MTHHGHDMDHDGKLTNKDSALFHEMVNGDGSNSSGDLSGCLLIPLLVLAVPLLLLRLIGLLMG